MKKLPKYTLTFDSKKESWKLESDKTDNVIRRFDIKEDATKRGILKKILGSEGGSVKIQKKESKKFQEERTYPKSRDPKESKG